MNPYEVWKEYGYRILEIERAAQNVDGLAVRINKTMVDDVRQMVSDRFEHQGPGWPALAASTITQRMKLGFAAGPMLVRSGALQNAAVLGKDTVTAETITLTLRDGSAPRYKGGGQAGRRRINKQAARMIDANRRAGLSTAFMHSGRISDYAERLNAKRPFYGQPTDAELIKLVTVRNDWINRVVMAIDKGESLSSIGLQR